MMDKPVLLSILRPGNDKKIPIRSNVKVHVHITTRENPEFLKESYTINPLKDNGKLHLFFLEALLKSAQQSVLSLQFPNGHGITDTKGLLPKVPSNQHEEFLVRIEINEVELFVDFVPLKIRNLTSKDSRIIKSLEYDYFTFYYRMLDKSLKDSQTKILCDSVKNMGYTNTPEVLSRITAEICVYQLDRVIDMKALCVDFTDPLNINNLVKLETSHVDHIIGEGFKDSQIRKYGDLFEICILGMTKGEEAFYICKFEDQKLLLDIKLKSIENEKYWFECADDVERERYSIENQKKAKLFDIEKNYVAGLSRYYNAMRYLEPILVKSANATELNENFVERLEKFLSLKLKAIQILDELEIKDEINRKLEYLFTFEQIENMENVCSSVKIGSLIDKLKIYSNDCN